MHKVILFVSSYIPLYVLLVIKNILERCTEGGRFLNFIEKFRNAVFFDEVNDWTILLLLGLSFFSFVYLKRKMKATKNEKCYRVVKVKDETSNNYFNYISIYLLSCLGLTLNEIVDIFVLFFLMILVGYIYITNDLIYLNPTLNMMGFKAYNAELYSEATHEAIESIVICKKGVDMKANSLICGTGKYSLIVSNKNWCSQS